MLVLGRKEGESILIGDEIAVMVVGIKWGQVKLVVIAPKDVEVDRAEIRAKKIREKKQEK